MTPTAKHALFSGILVLITASVLEIASYLLSTTLPQPKRDDIPSLRMIESDASTIWKFKPNTPFMYHVDGRRIMSSTNSVGAHDTEWTPARLAKLHRALAIGDSFSFGWGVDLEEVWWKQLGELTAHSKQPLETFGAGYWFSTYDQHYLFLKRFFPIVRPALVIHALFPPHVLTELTRVHHFDSAGDLIRVSDPIIAVHDETLTRSVEGANAFSPLRFPFLISYPRRLLQQINFRHHYRDIIKLNVGEDVSYDDPLLKSRETTFEPGFAKLFTSLRLMDSYARANRAAFVAVIVPAVAQVVAGRLAQSVSSHGQEVLSSHYPQEKIMRFCEEHRIACLDPLDRFRELADKDQLYLPRDVHFSARGHTVFAEAVRDFLAETKALGE